MTAPRELAYSLAINEALHQMMETDPSVFLIGQGVKSPWYVGNTAKGLLERFGERRIIDTPVSENAVTGAGVGAAIVGMRPVVVHPRMDFMLYALDPIINEAANWHYMFGGNSQSPVVIWGIINRGGQQAAQHSQAFHALYSHIPGLKVVMPSCAYDAKGLMVSAIKDNNPVMFIDDRWLYGHKEAVPEELYSVPIGKAAVKREGTDVTLVSISYMVHECLKAAEILQQQGISAEVVDLRSSKPIDMDTVCKSVAKTKSLVVVDGGWKTCGFAAEVVTLAYEHLYGTLQAPVKRLTLPDIPAPAAGPLEDAYYIWAKDIVASVTALKQSQHSRQKVVVS